MQSIQSIATKVLLNGHIVDAGSLRHTPEHHQEDLRRAKEVHGHGLCQCRAPGLRLALRSRSAGLHVAVWPGEAHIHRPDCPFFNEQAHYTGRASKTKSKEACDESVQPYLPAVRSDTRKPASAGYDSWSLIHHLWESSRLNSWVPGWHRDWTMARGVLMAAATHTQIDGVPLAEGFYIPPVFTADRRTAIDDLWNRFAEQLWNRPRGMGQAGSAFMLGLVRDLSATSNGYLLRLRHHGPGIMLGRALSDNLTRMSRRGWANATHPEPGVSVVALVRVESLRDRTLVAADCVLMRATARLIPSNCPAEDSIANQLMDTNREFSRPLSYAQATGELPTFVLRDTGRTITEMYMFGTGMPVHQLMKRTEELLVAAPQRNTKVWIWARGNDQHPPALPMVDRRAR